MPHARRFGVNYYQPKDPKAKLHEVATTYIAAMLKVGFAPNCSVAFSNESGAVSPDTVRGWLLKDPEPEAQGARYVVLDDGDVWREVEAPAPEGGGESRRTWLNGLDDDAVMLLHHSLRSARMSGDGYLEQEEHVQLRVLDDRRHQQASHPGPERRASR
jgi:hypothetical protein